MARIRYHVAPRDAPPAIAARALGLTLEQFTVALPELLRRGFPPADPTTGNFDLKAIDAWQDARHHRLFGGDGTAMGSQAVVATRELIRKRLQAQSEPARGAPELKIDQDDDREWVEAVRSSPLGKLERRALEGYFNARGQTVHVKGAGISTISRLEARGFIEATGDGFGVADHRITPAGEAEWRRLAGSCAITENSR